NLYSVASVQVWRLGWRRAIGSLVARCSRKPLWHYDILRREQCRDGFQARYEWKPDSIAQFFRTDGRAISNRWFGDWQSRNSLRNYLHLRARRIWHSLQPGLDRVVHSSPQFCRSPERWG